MTQSVGRVVAAIFMVSTATLDAQSQDFKCNYTRKIECTASGCQSGQIGTAYLLLPHVDSLFSATIAADTVTQLPTIRRCDSKGCSPVPVRASLSGAFVNIIQDDGAYFVRISTVDLADGLRAGDFVEVASLMLSTITYFGTCAAAVK